MYRCEVYFDFLIQKVESIESFSKGILKNINWNFVLSLLKEKGDESTKYTFSSINCCTYCFLFL
jgi:hypothetical protein